MSHEMMKSRERRLSLMAERNMCSVAMRDTSSCRGPFGMETRGCFMVLHAM